MGELLLELWNCTHFRYPTDDQLLIFLLFQQHHSSVCAVSIKVLIYA